MTRAMPKQRLTQQASPRSWSRGPLASPSAASTCAWPPVRVRYPTEPEPFDPLPVCSPGMLTGDDGLPLSSAPGRLSARFPENGILVDDPGHPRDLTAAVRAVFDKVFGANADARWNEAAALLDPRTTTFVLGSHRASSSTISSATRRAAARRRSSGSSARPRRYSVWLYAHRLTRDSFFQIQNE